MVQNIHNIKNMLLYVSGKKHDVCYVTLYCIYYVYINIFFFLIFTVIKKKAPWRRPAGKSVPDSLEILFIALYCTALHSTGLN